MRVLRGLKVKHHWSRWEFWHLTHIVWSTRFLAVTPTLPRALITTSSGPGLSWSAPWPSTFRVLSRERNSFGTLLLLTALSEKGCIWDLGLETKQIMGWKGITKWPQIFMAGSCGCCCNRWFNSAHLDSIETFWGKPVAWLRTQVLESDSLGSNPGSTSLKLCTLGQVTKPLWASDSTCKKNGDNNSTFTGCCKD